MQTNDCTSQTYNDCIIKQPVKVVSIYSCGEKKYGKKLAAPAATGGCRGKVERDQYHVCRNLLLHNNPGDDPHPCWLSGLENDLFTDQNLLTSGVRNFLAFAFIIPTFYFFGW